MTDAHIYLEKSDYSVEWIEPFCFFHFFASRFECPVRRCNTRETLSENSPVINLAFLKVSRNFNNKI